MSTKPKGKLSGKPIEKPTGLIILSGGGFDFETRRFLADAGDSMAFTYLRTEFASVPGQGGIPAGEVHEVPSFATVTKRSVRASLRAFLVSFVKALTLIRGRSIDFVLAVGCSHAVPMLLAGRLCKRPTIFIESITRVDQLSNTGKLVYRLRLASSFVVQWPGLQARYPGTQLGTLL